MCEPTCDWVATKQEDPILKTAIKWISNQKVQDLKHLLGDNVNKEEVKAILESRKGWHSTKKPSTIAKHWLVSCRKFAVCSYHGSSSGCHEWMSLSCWTPGSAANSVPTTGLVLVDQHGHRDAESDKQLQMMHPTWGTWAKVPMQPIIATASLE